MKLSFEEMGATPASYTDDHPLYLFLNGTVSMRSNVILDHPDVIGFVYINDGTLTKAFLPKKVVNFKASPNKRTSIAAVTGEPDNYIPILVSESDLFSDTLHFTDSTTLDKQVSTVSVGKYLKDNQDDLPPLPTEFSSEAKVCKLLNIRGKLHPYRQIDQAKAI